MFDWSYDLLSNKERLLFERLSVFAGGWTLEAAEQVAGSHALDQDDVLDGLAQLTDASLVHTDFGADGARRYRFLQTLHQYSREKLSSRNEQELLDARRGHAMYFRDLAERTGNDLLGPQQAVEFERLEREHDNLRAALSWAVASEDMDLGLRLSAALVRFWTVRCHFSEGRQWFERFIGLAQRAGDADRDALATIINGAGNFATMRADYDTAGDLLRQSLQLRRQLGDQMGSARTLLNLGNVAFSQGNYATATQLFEECLEIRRELGDTRGTARVLNNLSVLARDTGHVERMTELAEEALLLSRQVGDQEGIALALVSLGVAAHLRHDFAEAMALLKQSLSLFAELRHLREIAECLELIAGVSCHIGQPDRAGVLLGAAEVLVESVGLVPLPADRFEYQQTVTALHAVMGADGLAARWAEGRALNSDSAVAEALRV
jgi:tetratricopeptide (TPR) repeat protein